MKLRDIAHGRTGDKGNSCNIGVIAWNGKDYPLLKEKLTAERVKEFFSEFCLGKVTRYEVDSICGLNFVLEDVLDGGVTRSLRLDRHGKSLGMALFEMEI